MVILTNENSETCQAHSIYLLYFLGLLLIHPQLMATINVFFSKASYLRYFITSSAVKKKHKGNSWMYSPTHPKENQR